MFSMMSMTTGSPDLRTNLAWYDKVIPYASFGLGFYKPSYSLDSNEAPIVTTGASTPGIASTMLPLLFGVHIGRAWTSS